VGRYQKGKTSLEFTEARDCEWWWHQLGCMQVCTLLQTDNHASTPPLSFLQARCPSCRPTNSVKALAYKYDNNNKRKKIIIINVFVWHRKVVTLEALGPGSVLLRKGREKAWEKRNVFSLDLNIITDSFQ